MRTLAAPHNAIKLFPPGIGHLQMLERNDWRFIGADIDQGFFFYMMRVKVQSGGDIRLLPCITERQTAKGKQHAHYFHYGAVGGCKPWNCLDDLWRTVPKLKKDGELRGPKYDEIAFAIGWARRTLALFPRVDYLYALSIKFYTMVHMSRILSHRCDGIPKLAVATVTAMSVL